MRKLTKILQSALNAADPRDEIYSEKERKDAINELYLSIRKTRRGTPKDYPTYTAGVWLKGDAALQHELPTMMSGQLEELVRSKMPDLGTNLYADLLNWAIGRIDFIALDDWIKSDN